MSTRDQRALEQPLPFKGNRFDRTEWAGAFGDLGTLIPFVVAYISLLKMDPHGVLLAFGAALIVSGLYYKTPFPIQPMKAIGAIATTQAAQTITITPNAVYGAGVVTGIIWFVLGITGAAKKVAELVSRPVAVGIVLGLGFSFMLGGVKMIADGWLLGGAALLGTMLLLANRAVPVMFLLLLAGASAAVARDPALLNELATINVDFKAPSFALNGMTWRELAIGAVFLALPQVPLTLGNAVIAITEENNRLFPERPVTEKKVAISTGIMNLLGPMIGSVPMCHGAGGMAGHVRFGAKTGGAPIILGTILVVVALFFSGSVQTLFKIFPTPILGVILFLTGAQLALGSCDLGQGKNDRFVSLVTAACAVWNIGVAFVVGLAAYHLLKRGLARL
ncbi:MAG TPA: putative sulfate/molybdate transporter [Burkholderiales bacterium]|nr:putative sulfate/molybdate transporter [Burkholderiales bacterium]